MSLAVTKRVLLTTVLTAAVAFSVNGQSNQQPAASDLELTLSTTTLLTCLGSSLPLKLEIRNQGTREMKIDKVDLWSQFTYGFSGPGGSGRGGGSGTGCDPCRGNLVLIEPGHRYEDSMDYHLGSEFFKDAGKYTLKMHYGELATNQLSFELYDCNPK